MQTIGCQYRKPLVPSMYVPYCSTAGVGQYGGKGKNAPDGGGAGSTMQYAQT